MALVNQAKREINAKIVFFGPGLAGKATNLKHVYSKLKPDFRGAMKAMNVQDARMLFFDFTPPGDGNVHGFRVRFHVYTVSGQVLDPAPWKMVLKGVDGIVFVADSAPQRQAANRESLESLTGYLKAHGQSLGSVPMVFQFNKSDLPDALQPAELERSLNPTRFPSFKASSQSGEGVLQTVLGLVKTVLNGLRDKGLEGVASSESLQGMVQAPAPASVPLSTQAPADAAVEEAPAAEEAPALGSPEAPAAQTPVQHPYPQQAPSQEAYPEETLAPAPAEPAGERAPAGVAAAEEEPLTLELAGTPEISGPGLVRLPLTIRSGARSKTVVLSLTLALEEG